MSFENAKDFYFLVTSPSHHVYKIVTLYIIICYPQVRAPEKALVTIPTECKVQAVARNACHPDRVYIITGGLGGFGLELANWLVDRGENPSVYDCYRDTF